MYVVLLGAPGAGKGTQASVLSREMKLPHVASGDLFREALQSRTKLGLLAKPYMEKGELVPDEITINMIVERIDLPDCTSGCLLDGFPRTLDQAEALDKRLAEVGRSIDKAVYIDVPEDELVKRLSGRWICRHCQAPYHVLTSAPRTPGKCDRCGGELYQRADDQEETVRERFRVFFSQTVPILDYYRRQHKLVEVDGCKGIQELAREISSLLKIGED